MTLESLLALLRQTWAQRTAREQILIAAAAALFALTAVWSFMLAPALAHRDAMRASYEAQLEDHLQLVAGIERYRALRGAGDAEPQSAASLRTLVGSKARETGVPITRIQPLENGQVSVWTDPVAEGDLMGLLLDLARSDNVRVTRLSLDREGDGRVRSQVVLARAGSAGS
ncbi:hypothetical protein DDZ18_10445 [Marinicauda salina]|uniref:Type II secretion system protein M n=1 Tax=Marinicauda salina TaxID=2135793 RepID=A0A2U2BSX0_9PROT|nr:type II secretion system protein GspM [Marinicauda salina]PWE17109.1 hypothetical protein DDZ18_10445 [Marinicauda salina]